MDEKESLNHTKWECKYDVVFIPKCRRKTLHKELRRLPEQKESGIKEGHLMPDHVHMMIVIPQSKPRQRPPIAALSGSQTKAPGFVGGYLSRLIIVFKLAALLSNAIFQKLLNSWVAIPTLRMT